MAASVYNIYIYIALSFPLAESEFMWRISVFELFLSWYITTNDQAAGEIGVFNMITKLHASTTNGSFQTVFSIQKTWVNQMVLHDGILFTPLTNWPW